MLNHNSTLFFILLLLFLVNYCGDPAFISSDSGPNKIPAQAREPVIVLELFTSQGCSSCPPADKLLKQVAETYNKATVVALAYHVDYWNYIGWEDPFSQAKFTGRQRSYAQKFGDSRIYTPQLVINGKEHMVGSNTSRVFERLQSYSSHTAKNVISINQIKRRRDSLWVQYAVSGKSNGLNLRAVLKLNGHFTKVTLGENRGRGLHNSHIVIDEMKRPLSSPSGEIRMHIARDEYAGLQMHLALITENADLDITGAAEIAVPIDGLLTVPKN